MSSSSSSSSEDDNGNANGNDYDAPRRDIDFGGPSLTRRRAINETWPGPFLEDLIVRVAIDAFRSYSRLAVAIALANVFQVCSTWRAVSHSAPLWFRLTRIIWGRNQRMHPTWRDEYVYRHRTFRNFRVGGVYHHTLHFDPSDADVLHGLTCRCLTLSDTHLACGFADGTVRVFELATREHVRTFIPYQGERFGCFSYAVVGIIIAGNKIIFATLDGDIHVAIMDGQPFPRRAHIGNVVEDGPLVDFTGCGRWWVGLYAGVPGHAFQLWDGNTEEMVYVNPLIASFTNSVAMTGWHMLTEFIEPIARVRMTSRETTVACTSSRYMILDLRNQGFPLHDHDHRRGVRVSCFDTNNEAFITVDNQGRAIVRRVETLDEVCRFHTRQRTMTGCMNWGYALMCAGGVVRVWEIEHGQYLYSLNENLGVVNTMVADDRYVAAVSRDTTIHLWDFGSL